MWGSSGFGGHKDGGGNTTSPSFSQTQTFPSKSKARKSQTFVPILTADIYRSLKNDDTVMIGETEAAILTVVGLIRKVDLQSTVHIYQIDDMTGPCLLVKKFLEESDDDELPSSLLMENTYARVSGIPRKMQDLPFLVVVEMRPITDLNELTMHLLEVVHTKLLLTRGFDSKGNTSTNQIGGGNGNVDMIGQSSDIPNDLLKSFTKPQAMVLQLLTSCPDPQGYNMRFITEKLRLSQHEIREALGFLCNEGHAYTTCDDETYKATGGC